MARGTGFLRNTPPTQPRTTSGDMFRGMVVLGNAIDQHLGHCTHRQLLEIALTLEDAGYAITRAEP